MFVNKNMKIKSDMMILLLTRWNKSRQLHKVHAVTRVTSLTIPGSRNWSKEVKKYPASPALPQGEKNQYIYNILQEKTKHVQQAAVTGTEKQKKKITVVHDLNTCWVTTTKKQRPCTAHAGPTPSEIPRQKWGGEFTVQTQNRTKVRSVSPPGALF